MVLTESNGSYTEFINVHTCKSQGELTITEPTFRRVKCNGNICEATVKESCSQTTSNTKV